MLNRLRNAVTSVLRREPARLLGAVAAGATFAASLFQDLGIETWQAAVPVLFAEAVRRLVYSPETVDAVLAVIDDLIAEQSK